MTLVDDLKRPHHYPPVTREDWRAHWRYCWALVRVLLITMPCAGLIGAFIGRFVL